MKGDARIEEHAWEQVSVSVGLEATWSFEKIMRFWGGGTHLDNHKISFNVAGGQNYI